MVEELDLSPLDEIPTETAKAFSRAMRRIYAAFRRLQKKDGGSGPT